MIKAVQTDGFASTQHAVISLRNVWLSDPSSGAKLENATLNLPTNERLAVLCRNQAERLAMVQLISGQSRQDRGDVSIPVTVSFPVGALNVLNGGFSAEQNIRFLSRLYGLAVEDMRAFVKAMVGPDAPLKTSLRKLAKPGRLSMLYALSYAVPCDLYVADIMALPPSRAGGTGELRRFVNGLTVNGNGLLLFTSTPPHALSVAETGAIMEDGHLKMFATVKEAVQVFKQDTGSQPAAVPAPLLLH